MTISMVLFFESVRDFLRAISPKHGGCAMPTFLLVFVASCAATGVVLVSSVLARNAQEIVTTRCAQRWFEDTTTLGGLTVDYETTHCHFERALEDGRVECSVAIEGFEPPYIACVPVRETLVAGECACEMPEGTAP